MWLQYDLDTSRTYRAFGGTSKYSAPWPLLVRRPRSPKWEKHRLIEKETVVDETGPRRCIAFGPTRRRRSAPNVT
jgi:hypothetical protein